MDPEEAERLRQALADSERFKQALASQGARMGQHDKALQEIMTALQSLSAGVDQLGGRLNEVATQLTSLKPPDPAIAPDAVQAPGPAPSAVQPTQPREPFIPTPTRYSGEIGLCKHFIHQCRLVFDQQPQTYCSEGSKVAFVMSLLSGKASAWAVALTGSNSPLCQTLESFTSEMLRVFDHPLQSKEASGRLLSLRQGSGPVSAYSIDFRILATECGWDDKALQGIFFRGLSEEVKDELAARDETSNLEELISLSIRLDDRLRERRRERSGRYRYPVPSPHTSSPRQPELPPAASPQEFATTTTSVTPSPSSEEPMQLGRMKLTPEERQRRFNQRLCIYCGEGGHILSDCPKRPKDRARQPPEGRW